MKTLCKFKDCSKRGTYGYIYNEILACEIHRILEPIESKMVNVRAKRCIKCEISLSPAYGYIDGKATHCSKCKEINMVNLRDNKCYCGRVEASYGYKDGKRTHCSECAIDGMIDVLNKLCEKCEIKRPNFGLDISKPPTHCFACKTNEMNSTSKMCVICDKVRPNYGLVNGKPTHCIKCKSIDMLDVVHKLCIATDISGILYCTVRGNPKYKGYCSNCFKYIFPTDPLSLKIRCNTKELIVRNFINTNFEGFSHDRPIWTNNCECIHKRRIDHRKIFGNTLLCIGTDENQHKSKYYILDNEIRYNEAFKCLMIHGGKFIYIRFNPDKYKENGVLKNPLMEDRLKELKNEINKQIIRIENEENTDPLEIIYMYYDL